LVFDFLVFCIANIWTKKSMTQTDTQNTSKRKEKGEKKEGEAQNPDLVLSQLFATWPKALRSIGVNP